MQSSSILGLFKNRFAMLGFSPMRGFFIVSREFHRTSLLKSFSRCNSSSGKKNYSDSFRPRHRIKSSDKDPFGYAFSQSVRQAQPLDSPNVIFEERFRRHQKIVTPAEQRTLPQQEFDYFLVLDFEATCDKPVSPIPQEIIEFPVIKVDSRTMKAHSTFHQYVRPTVHPELSPFCSRLTGIIQDMVDNQPTLEMTLRLFDQWIEKEGLSKPDVRFTFVTCGDWDLGEMLLNQAIGHYPRSLQLMLDSLGIQHTGRAHSGIDDCTNIVNILEELAHQGHIFHNSGSTDKSRTTTVNSQKWNKM